MNKERVAFTGSQTITTLDKQLIEEVISSLEEPELFITGGCIGVDHYVAQMIQKHFPNTKHVIVLPGNMSKVPDNIRQYATTVISMPYASAYRERNEMMVRHATRLVTFWTGKKRYSGTFMTMNIANKQNKLNIKDIFMIGDKAGEDPRNYYDK